MVPAPLTAGACTDDINADSVPRQLRPIKLRKVNSDVVLRANLPYIGEGDDIGHPAGGRRGGCFVVSGRLYE